MKLMFYRNSKIGIPYLGLILLFVSCIYILSCKTESRNIKTLTQKQQLDTIIDYTPIDTLEEVILKEKIDFDTTLWAEILPSPTLILDLKYASMDNFTKEKIYDCARCFLRLHVAEVLFDFQKHLEKRYGLGIIIYDCYRPRPYQQKLWDIVPDRRYVTPPKKGSMHNRGMAIDIGLVDSIGHPLDMGSAFDHFGQESFHSATNISAEAIKNRKLLKSELAKYGFKGITSEWWHYSYRKDVMPLSDWVWKCE